MPTRTHRDDGRPLPRLVLNRPTECRYRDGRRCATSTRAVRGSPRAPGSSSTLSPRYPRQEKTTSFRSPCTSRCGKSRKSVLWAKSTVPEAACFDPAVLAIERMAGVAADVARSCRRCRCKQQRERLVRKYARVEQRAHCRVRLGAMPGAAVGSGGKMMRVGRASKEARPRSPPRSARCPRAPGVGRHAVIVSSMSIGPVISRSPAAGERVCTREQCGQ